MKRIDNKRPSLTEVPESETSEERRKRLVEFAAEQLAALFLWHVQDNWRREREKRLDDPLSA